MHKKGTIVLIPFPFTDLSDNKIRPALILFSDKKSVDIIVVFITSNINHRGLFDVSITPSSANGIKTPSKIVCDKIASLDKKIVIGKVGECEAVIMKEVTHKLKDIFNELPRQLAASVIPPNNL